MIFHFGYPRLVRKRAREREHETNARFTSILRRSVGLSHEPMSQPASTSSDARASALSELHPTIIDVSSSSQSVNVTGSVEVEIEGFEILDSEDGSDADDPFKVLIRPRTEPSISASRCRDNGNRSSTGPARVRKKRQRVDLLEVLLPENYEISGLDMESTVIQSSREQGSGLYSSDDSNGKLYQGIQDTIDCDEILITSTRTNEPTGQLLQGERQDTDTAIENGEVIKLPSSSVERLDSFQMTDTFPVGSMLSTEEICEEASPPPSDSLIKRSAESQSINETSDKGEQPMSKSPTEGRTDDTDTSSDTHATKMVIPPRRPKRKATLSDLCSRKAKLPYRVGLSRRANVQHLHSYLSKR